MGRHALVTSSDGWSKYLPARHCRMHHITPYPNLTSSRLYQQHSTTQRSYKKKPCTSKPPSHHPHCRKPTAAMASSSSHNHHQNTKQPRTSMANRPLTHSASHSRTSFPYPIPQRLQGHLQPPQQLTAYILNNPNTWPYARACLAADRELERMKKRESKKATAPRVPQLTHPPLSPTNMPCCYRSTLNPTQLNKLLTWLPLPPDPSHPYWDG